MGGTPFKALSAGELFLFKLHAPNHSIVGGGVFAHDSLLPCSLAWEAFGRANGASSFTEMRSRIAKYRPIDPASREDFVIGCRILTQPFFLDWSDWIPVPSWAPQIVQGKTYSVDESDGAALWETVAARLQVQPDSTVAERFGAPVLVRPRLGQGAFRLLVTDSYHRRCAVTQERTLPALDAAHVRPLPKVARTRLPTASCSGATFTACSTVGTSRSRLIGASRSAAGSRRNLRTDGTTMPCTDEAWRCRTMSAGDRTGSC